MPALSDSSDESDADHHAENEGSSRGTPAQANPMDVRFSQKKMRHMFWNGNLLSDVAPLVQTVRCSDAEEAILGARWKVVAPFPAIMVFRWRCKLRDDRTGRPKVDQQTGATLYDSEEHLFTLDNRRLYCLQLAASRVWPEPCVIDVSQLPPGPPQHMYEMKKLKTMDCGKSILIGSRQDKVPFVRWSWRTKLQVADDPVAGKAHARKGGAGKAAAASGGKGKGKGKPARDDATIPHPSPSEFTNPGALLLGLLKDGGNTPLASGNSAAGATQGAFLLDLLKGNAPQPTAPFTASSPQEWGSSGSWWEGGEQWQGRGETAPCSGGYNSRTWNERGRR